MIPMALKGPCNKAETMGMQAEKETDKECRKIYLLHKSQAVFSGSTDWIFGSMLKPFMSQSNCTGEIERASSDVRGHEKQPLSTRFVKRRKPSPSYPNMQIRGLIRSLLLSAHFLMRADKLRIHHNTNTKNVRIKIHLKPHIRAISFSSSGQAFSSFLEITSPSPCSITAFFCSIEGNA